MSMVGSLFPKHNNLHLCAATIADDESEDSVGRCFVGRLSRVPFRDTPDRGTDHGASTKRLLFLK